MGFLLRDSREEWCNFFFFFVFPKKLNLSAEAMKIGLALKNVLRLLRFSSAPQIHILPLKCFQLGKGQSRSCTLSMNDDRQLWRTEDCFQTWLWRDVWSAAAHVPRIYHHAAPANSRATKNSSRDPTQCRLDLRQKSINFHRFATLCRRRTAAAFSCFKYDHKILTGNWKSMRAHTFVHWS